MKKAEKKNSKDHQSEAEIDDGALTEVDSDEVLSDVIADSDISSDIPSEVRFQVSVLNDVSLSWSEVDRAAARHATKVLAYLTAKKLDEVASLISEGGGIPALVKHLQAPPSIEADQTERPYEHDVERGSALALAYLAAKDECKHLILGCGALPLILSLLNRHKEGGVVSLSLKKLLRSSAFAIVSLAAKDNVVKELVRKLGGIPLVVDLLDFPDSLVQMATLHAVCTLVVDNNENKLSIVELNALPSIISMLESENSSIQYLPGSLIRGLITNSSAELKEDVVVAGALQPIIRLLSSSRLNIIDATSMVVELSKDADCRAHLVQRGALTPLIQLLDSNDDDLKEASAHALAYLARDTHNQAGIAYSGGLQPLLKLLKSHQKYIQEVAAFALSNIAANKDNVVAFISMGGVQDLLNGDLILQETKDFANMTLQRLEDIVQERQVLTRLSRLMREAEDVHVQMRVALALAHLCSRDDQHTIFIDKYGLELLLGLISSPSRSGRLDAAAALCKLANNAKGVSYVGAFTSPTPQIDMWHLPSDITFHVEGQLFHVHRDCLVASSDAFRAMLDGDYQERDALDIEISDIGSEVFEMMMRFIYTGCVVVSSDLAQHVLIGADLYLLEDLKRLCEDVLSQDLSIENVIGMYNYSEKCYAYSLRNRCILFILDHFDHLSSRISPMIPQLVPKMRVCFVELLAEAC